MRFFFDSIPDHSERRKKSDDVIPESMHIKSFMYRPLVVYKSMV